MQTRSLHIIIKAVILPLAALFFILTLYSASWGGAGRFTDAVGREVLIKENPQRIICLTPSLSETCFALGLGDKIVGVSTWSDYPPAARKVQCIGDYISPNLELIAALKPDLVLADREGNPEWAVEQLERAGIPVFVVWSRNFSELERNFIILGDITGARARGKNLAADFRSRLNKIKNRLAGVEKTRVLMVIQNRPLVSVGDDTLHGLVLKTVGAINMAAGAPGRWPRLSPETVIASPPRVIVVTTMEKGSVLEQMLQYWRDMPGVGDHPNVRVEAIESDIIDRPGPRLAQGLEKLVRLIHPDLFAGEGG